MDADRILETVVQAPGSGIIIGLSSEGLDTLKAAGHVRLNGDSKPILTRQGGERLGNLTLAASGGVVRMVGGPKRTWVE